MRARRRPVHLQTEISNARFLALFREQSRGSLELSGKDPLNQTFQLSVSEGKSPARVFNGSAYLSGSLKFTSLDMKIQQSITDAIGQSGRPGLKTGDLVLYTNTKDKSESTLNIYLMPDGEIGYLQIGVLQVLWM